MYLEYFSSNKMSKLSLKKVSKKVSKNVLRPELTIKLFNTIIFDL